MLNNNNRQKSLSIFSPSLPWLSSWSSTAHLFLKYSSHQTFLWHFLNLLPPLLSVSHFYIALLQPPCLLLMSSFGILTVLLTFYSPEVPHLHCLDPMSVSSYSAGSKSHSDTVALAQPLGMNNSYRIVALLNSLHSINSLVIDCDSSVANYCSS